MIDQFRNFDAPGKPQKLHIQWELLTPDDEHADAPDEMQDGYWPSLDPDEAGYIGDDPTDVDGSKQEARLAEQMEEAQHRYDGFGNWWNYVGVVARAHISVPIGGGAFCTFQIDSPGVWGIESDAGEYLKTVFAEQQDELRDMLKIMGLAIQSGDMIETE